MYESMYHPKQLTDDERKALKSSYVPAKHAKQIDETAMFYALMDSGGSPLQTSKKLGVSESRVFSAIKENLLYQIWQEEAKREKINHRLVELYLRADPEYTPF